VVLRASSRLLDVDGDYHGVWDLAACPHPVETSQSISATYYLLVYLLYDDYLLAVGVEKWIGLEPSSMDAAIHQHSKSPTVMLPTISTGFDVSSIIRSTATQTGQSPRSLV
jgi:hypothetical protein